MRKKNEKRTIQIGDNADSLHISTLSLVIKVIGDVNNISLIMFELEERRREGEGFRELNKKQRRSQVCMNQSIILNPKVSSFHNDNGA